MLGAGEIVFLREEQTNWVSITKWSNLKTYINVTVYKVSRLYLGMYICMYVYAVKGYYCYDETTWQIENCGRKGLFGLPFHSILHH